MRLLARLILREAWYHRARISLAVLATIAMSCMIVWLVGSLDLMMVRFDQDAENYLGHYHVIMMPEQDAPPGRPASPGPFGSNVPRRPGPRPAFPESVIKELRDNELVMEVVPARQLRVLMGKMEHEQDERAAIRRERSVTGTPARSPAVIAVDTDASPFELIDGRWFSEDSETAEGVMGTGAAASLQGWGDGERDPVKVGDTVICRVESNDFKVKVVGLFEQKLSSGDRGVNPVAGALFVSPKTADTISPPAPGEPARIDYVYVRLREGADTRRFEETWSEHLREQGVAMSFLDVDAVQEQLDGTRSRSAAGLMGGAASRNAILIFSTLVSVLIVFTALSMGVSERTRVFAMLRTVGMSRRRIAALVFGESIILCLFGWLGGTAAGWFVLQLSVWLQPEFYGTGKTVSLGMAPVATAGVAALIGSLLAAILPAWRATRISPLEGMNRGSMQAVARGRFLRLAALGALLLVLNPIFVYHAGMAEGAELRLFLYTYIGLPTQIAGCLLLAPAAILLVETLFGPITAKMLRLPKELLACQLSGNLWRTLGTTLALCVGLGVYSFLEISGYSMLVPYVHSRTLPNTLVTILPSGLPPERIDSVRNLPGVDSDRFLTIALDQSHFSQQQTDRFLAQGLAEMQTSAVVFGIDIKQAFGKRGDGSRPLIEVDFQEGTLDRALEKLETGGRYCLVPDSFAFRTGLHVGDKLELVLPPEPGSRGETSGGPPGRGRRGGPGGRPGGRPGGGRGGAEKIVEYEICGVVSIHGWLWMNKISGVRKRGYRSGAMLLAPYEAVKNDYRLTDAAYFWFDRTKDASGKPTVSDRDLEESLQQLADRYVAGRAGTPLRPDDGRTERTVTHPMVKVSSREYLTERVGSRADQVIQAAARMPLILLAISSFGMMGTIAASVRSRRFEFGVLRSLGVTRFGLVRLILSEALLISLAVIVISVGFGVIGAWCFIGLMRYLSVFGGFVSPLTIPVGWLSIGFIVTLALCFLAAIGPAVVAGRTDPTRLLRERS